MSTPTAQRLESVKEYYFSKKLREVAALIKAGNPILNMGIGSPDLAPSQEVLNAIQEAVLESGAHQYQSYQGLPQLRAGIANFYKNKFQKANINFRNLYQVPALRVLISESIVFKLHIKKLN